jgi:hypothetical protein
MQHEGGPGGRDTNHHRHSNHQPSQPGIGCSIRSGTAVPPTVLIADMCDGGLLLQSWRDGPTAYRTSSDAIPLRRELAASFDTTELTLSGDVGEAL